MPLSCPHGRAGRPGSVRSDPGGKNRRQLGHEAVNRDIDIFVQGDYLLTAKVGKTGIIKVHKNNKIGRILVDAVNMGEKIKLVPK